MDSNQHRATFSGVNPKRHSAPEAGAYDLLRDGLASLREAERALTIIEDAAPDLERAVHLVAVRTAISLLVMFVSPPWPRSSQQPPPARTPSGETVQRDGVWTYGFGSAIERLEQDRW
jgi:hypothetical protein